MYSQNDEERFILDAVRDIEPAAGFFLDIGAQDGVTNSNTRALAELGWTGVCIECAPDCLGRLISLYPPGGRVRVLPFALHHEHDDRLLFYAAGSDGVGTTNPAHRDLWIQRGGVRYEETRVSGRTWAEIIGTVGCGFQVLSLDVEGVNLEHARRCPWPMLRDLRVVCVEKDNEEAEPGSRDGLLELFGPAWPGRRPMRLVYESAENLVFVRE